MKPTFHSATNKGRPFPPTDYFFQSGIGDSRGYSSPEDGDSSEFRHLYSLNREFLMVCAQERAREMTVFALVVLAAAWPVIYMVIIVLKLLLKGRPLS
ncbi:MAG: hypothetical protein ABI925_02155 [Verrucomicrobiota bacterium]